MKAMKERLMSNPDLEKIPMQIPYITGREMEYVAQAVQNLRISGDGAFTAKCSRLLESRFKAHKAFLTTSCTTALEMAAILAEVGPGDEVIMPSFTFVSTANAFCLRGAKPVFVEIRPDTLCMDVDAVARAITPRTKVIVPVHYGGMACDMVSLMALADKHGILVVEDAAQGIDATYKGRYLGTIGHLGTYSFHETKNVSCGEGGALIINDDRFTGRAEIIREKGTNRSRFLRGQADKYTWHDIGSSFLPSDLLAAFLLAQLESIDTITAMRKKRYAYYLERLARLDTEGLIELPRIQPDVNSNYHLFYMLLGSEEIRNQLLEHLRANGIGATFHFLPLHLAPMGRKYGYGDGDFPISESVSTRLLRLPFYTGLEEAQQERIVREVENFFAARSGSAGGKSRIAAKG
jgi:dTDP-4-amino-4,6-dideoxygalactose transaminase